MIQGQAHDTSSCEAPLIKHVIARQAQYLTFPSVDFGFPFLELSYKISP